MHDAQELKEHLEQTEWIQPGECYTIIAGYLL